jgi:hypothetical protein
MSTDEEVEIHSGILQACIVAAGTVYPQGSSNLSYEGRCRSVADQAFKMYDRVWMKIRERHQA